MNSITTFHLGKRFSGLCKKFFRYTPAQKVNFQMIHGEWKDLPKNKSYPLIMDKIRKDMDKREALLFTMEVYKDMGHLQYVKDDKFSTNSHRKEF
jgi:hypothetical protein